MEFPVPKSPKIYTEVLSNFLGVDYTSIMPSTNRASEMVNLVNNEGYLETRPGYNTVGHSFGTAASLEMEFGENKLIFTAITKGVEGNDISITIIKPSKLKSTLTILRDNKNLIISLGVDNNVIISTINDIVNLINPLVTITYAGDGNAVVTPVEQTFLKDGENRIINGIWNLDDSEGDMFICHVEDKLYKLDSNFSNPEEIEIPATVNNTLTQQSGLVIDNKLYLFDGKRVIVYGKFETVWEIKYLDSIGTVPTTIISQNPDGTGGTSFEEINLIQPYRINSFLADGVAKTYKLDSVFDDEMPTATILMSDGTISNLPIQSYSRTAQTVTFVDTPPASPVVGRDNVFVRFKVTNEENKDYINGCTITTLYGYDGADDRIFVSGNKEYPNIDWFSLGGDPTYFPINNYTKVGFHPIVSYLRLNDGTLAIQKQLSDTDSTIYYRRSAIYNGDEIFPISAGVKSIGIISRYCNMNLLNDPLTLTDLGVFSIIGSNNEEKFAMERSYFVKSKLLQEPNLKDAIAISFKDKYYLAVNNNVYVADSRYKSEITESINSDFQYEWYYWENVPVHIWFTYNNELYFCTKSGNIVKFNDTCLDYTLPIECTFATAFLDLNSITVAKTVKRVTVISKPLVDTEYSIGFITNDETQEISRNMFVPNDFPSTLQEKEKIKKFMFVKLYLTNDTDKKLNFYQIALEYVYSGNYRGE